jgi:hypothetical protein
MQAINVIALRRPTSVLALQARYGQAKKNNDNGDPFRRFHLSPPFNVSLNKS